eukprot:277976-Pelagomonas_calceolata.AAC.1
MPSGKRSSFSSNALLLKSGRWVVAWQIGLLVPKIATCKQANAPFNTQIEARTGKDIELKQHQLRQLVGNSYRSVGTHASV